MVLQQVHRQISLCRPFRAGNVPQPGHRQVQRPLSVRKGPDDARTATDLAQNALQGVNRRRKLTPNRRAILMTPPGDEVSPLNPQLWSEAEQRRAQRRARATLTITDRVHAGHEWPRTRSRGLGLRPAGAGWIT